MLSVGFNFELLIIQGVCSIIGFCHLTFRRHHRTPPPCQACTEWPGTCTGRGGQC